MAPLWRPLLHGASELTFLFARSVMLVSANESTQLFQMWRRCGQMKGFSEGSDAAMEEPEAPGCDWKDTGSTD